jgi:two-component system, cell cycle sensor histidine kinase PleC
MARSEAASAPARPDSIKGLAQSVAKPAYRRLVTAEPLLRRAVPILIVAFLVTIGVGAIVQVLEHRRQALADARTEIEILAELIGERLERQFGRLEGMHGAQAALDNAAPAGIPAGRRILLTDPLGTVQAALPPGDPALGHSLLDVIGSQQPVTTFAQQAGAQEITLPGDVPAFAAARTLMMPLGQIAIVQSRRSVLRTWTADTALTITLFATTGFVLLILGFAFHWQATRAREADAIFDTVRARIDAALNSGGCGLWDWDLERGRVFWSHSMFEIIGLRARDELLTIEEVSALVHPEDQPLHTLCATPIADGAGLADHVFRMRHAAGHWVWLRARCEFVEQPDEPGAHVVGIVVDITEQKDFAERTAAADVRLRDAIETISEAFVVWDPSNRLVLCNSKFQSLHNLPDAAVAPGTAYAAIVAASSKPVIRTSPTGAPSAEQDGLTFEAQLEDGRWLQISERRTKDGGFVSVGTDITILKEQAQELELLARKYAEEKTRAEQASHAKSEFLANMSHELRTPLNAIIGFSEMMETGVFGPLGERYHEYCRDIRDSGRYLLDVINDILDMAKIEAGRFELGMEQFDLSAVMNEALRIVAPRAQTKRLSLRTDVNETIPIWADRRGVKQIVLNLLSNAVKFTPDGGSVAVRTRVADSQIAIFVEDTGIGISRAALKNLGRPFEQVQPQLTKNHQGSGLGLAIAKSLTEMHGGALRIRSSEGVGTLVMVEIPIRSTPTRPKLSAPPARGDLKLSA